MSTSFFQELQARGLVQQTTSPDLEKNLNTGRLTLYAGFDPTSDSLHIGSLLPLLTLRRFQKAGHSVIAVIGGATGMIGDPSGKAQERSLMTDAQIDANLQGIKRVITRFLDLEGPRPAVVTNNSDWFKNLTFVDFLRDIGKHFTVNYMMAKESVRARLEDREHGISFTEFSYMLLQSYDFLHLHKTRGCRLQMGGSDQWGNITAGVELIRRMRAANGSAATEEHEVFGMTHPLVTKSDGSKFGKSEQGNVWLSADKTSPYKLFQFLVQTSDEDVVKFLNYFTFLSLEQIAALVESSKTSPEKREAQKTLAQEVVRLVHGEDELKKAEAASQALFGQEIKTLDAKTLKDVFSEAPSVEKDKAALSGYTLIDALVDTGLFSSKGAARKEIPAGGIYINNERCNDPAAILKPEHLIAGSCVVLRKGKRNYALIRFT